MKSNYGYLILFLISVSRLVMTKDLKSNQNFYSYPFFNSNFLPKLLNFQNPFTNFNQNFTQSLNFIGTDIISLHTNYTNLTRKDNFNHSNLNKMKNTLKQKNVTSYKCNPSDIYCLCKFHPKYHDCVCLAYPRSVTCSPTYCAQKRNTYECNPKFCDKKENLLHKNCFCLKNINSVQCKCKLNPFHKDCFCLKYPLSHICHDRICQFNPNSLYCMCKEKPEDPKCYPKFCNENPKSPLCECIVNPLNSKCRCINEPYSCSSKIKDIILR